MTQKFTLKKLNIVLLLIIVLLFSHQIVVFAQSEEQLKEELARTEQEIKEAQTVLNRQKVKSNTILGEVNKLTSQIKTVQKNIDTKNSVIKEIGSDISIKDQTVNQLNNKLDRSTEILSELVRAKNKIDDVSLFEIITAYQNLSDFFVGIDSVTTIQRSMDNLLDQIRELRGLTQDEKKKLEEKKDREQDLKVKIESEKKQVSVKQGEQNGLLAASKQIEKTHELDIAAKQKKAAGIRTALFKLRDSTGSITFEQALDFAQEASRTTGVRAGFILGILKQETNIGQYLGSCVITDLKSGSTRNVKTQEVVSDGIHPTRDLPILQEILGKLGRDPLTTLVSCPQAGGYGGAMGPSQFIPSTWKLYIPNLQNVFGGYPDPWNPEHSITATALLLRDNGGAGGAYTAEKNAACRYYSGRACDASQPPNAFYGNQVMANTDIIQANIDFLATVK